MKILIKGRSGGRRRDGTGSGTFPRRSAKPAAAAAPSATKAARAFVELFLRRGPRGGDVWSGFVVVATLGAALGRFN
jgi:hypothetical protein